MRCPACATDCPPGAKFCADCGARLVNACPRCGYQADPAARFCQECGGPLGSTAGPGGSSAAPTTEPEPTPDSYIPPHLAARILASRDALEGERKQVTVLFADITGSTELIQDLDPEDARALLEPAVSAMISAVHRFEGTVCRVMGDGIMALFGAPLAHEDHAVRACYAALTMQETIKRYGEADREQHGVEVMARVGLNSGEVVVGSISNDLYVEYSAIGQSTHLAARMEQLAVPGTIRLTGETLGLVEGLVEVRALGRIPVKGLSAPVPAFELLAAAAGRRRFQAAASRGLTPFVGRQAEITALQRALDLAAAGQGQIVAPVGEPGVGKSRLFYEFVHSHRTAGWTILESGSVSYGKATPWLPVSDLLKNYCRIEPSDDARTAREKLVGKLLALDRALETILTPLLALLDLPLDLSGDTGTASPAISSDARGQDDWLALDPTQRRRQTLHALQRLLLRESREQPLLLVFEDLHWIDAETQALLDGLVEALPTARILMLVNYRPEYTHAWGNKSYYTQLRIDPLGQASAEELLDALVGSDAGVMPLRDLLLARTGGNPFFLEESIRALIESGVLAGERGAYRLTRPVAEVRVPATVQAVLAARIDRLPTEEKRVLQTAAVIGKDVPSGLLQAIADRQDVDLAAGLASLQAAELLYPISLYPEPEYTFKHALTHEVAYGGLLQGRRKTLHARIVTAIEQLWPDRLEEHVERLAHHATRGDVWDQAARYCRQAGVKSGYRSASREAVAYFEDALAALDRLPPSQTWTELSIDVRRDLQSALFPLAEIERIAELDREKLALAESLGDRRRLGEVLGQHANLLWRTGRYRAAIDAGERACAIGVEIDDSFVQSPALHQIGNAQGSLGAWRAANSSYERVVALMHDHALSPRWGPATFLLLHSWGWLAVGLGQLGKFSAAIEYGGRAVERGEAAGHAFTVSNQTGKLAQVYLEQGEVDRAVPLLERGLDVSREHGYSINLPWLLAELGAAYALLGQTDRALALAEEARSLDAASPVVSPRLGVLTRLCEINSLAGRLDEAEQLAQSAIAQAEERDERGSLARAQYLLGTILARREHPDVGEAERYLREALGLAEELEMRPLQAHCHLALGKLYRQDGQQAEATAHLTTAVTMLREMEMAFWLPEAECERAAMNA